MSRFGIGLLYAAALGAGTYSAFGPTFDSGFARTQADAGDGMLNHYLLEHTWQAVSNRDYCGTLLTPPFFHPQPLTLAYSEGFLGVAPFYWVLRLGVPDHLAYQWWMIVCAALTFLAFAVVARWVGCNHPIAAFGAFLWAFALVHVEQGKHQQLIARFGMPLAAYYAWSLATAPTIRALHRLLPWLFIQTAASVYIGWFLGAGLLVFFPAAVVGSGGWNGLVGFLRGRRWAVAGIVAGWAIAFGAFFTPYAIANSGYGRDYREYLNLLPTLAAWLTGPPGSRWAESLGRVLPPVPAECRAFSGFGLYLLFLAAAGHAWATRRTPSRPPKMALVRACLLTAGFWWLITLNIGADVSGWWLGRFIPGGRAIRSVCRVYTIVYLFGTLGGVVWLSAVIDRLPARWRTFAMLAAIVPIGFEQIGYRPPTLDKAEFYPAADRIAARFRGADAGYLIPAPDRRSMYGDIVGMWAGMRANVPVVNGYSGRYPDNFPLEPPPPNADAAIRDWLSGRFRGRVAVVDERDPDRLAILDIE